MLNDEVDHFSVAWKNNGRLILSSLANSITKSFETTAVDDGESNDQNFTLQARPV